MLEKIHRRMKIKAVTERVTMKGHFPQMNMRPELSIGGWSSPSTRWLVTPSPPRNFLELSACPGKKEFLCLTTTDVESILMRSNEPPSRSGTRGYLHWTSAFLDMMVP